ncbi:hypothetical protein HMPREF8578_0958 [Streptococcus oralis ATCC 49296]|uniref:Uncharacterized protein n=1 Tax=Streptococcus oralis ATCC 49296 TaxID=888049 RepID=E6KL43_STROR|nr:hypothetical protein HMPREF8578_0958 [Streptococcus oralis ATCC 49296]
MVLGSPPRVREKFKTFVGEVDLTGITPACAGKIGYNQSPNGKSRDHPRVCGKNRLAKNIARAVVGSPPRMREKRGTEYVAEKDLGITPACAGKTVLRK